MARLNRSYSSLIPASVLALAGFVGACTDEPGDPATAGWGQNSNAGQTGGTTAGRTGGGTTGAAGTAAGGLWGGTGVPGGTVGAGTVGGGTVGTGGGTLGGQVATPGGIVGTAGGGGREGGGAVPGGAGGGANLPCNVAEIVSAKCGSCHGATPVSAPMSLVTSAQWQAAGITDKTKKIFDIAKVRINAAGNAAMPPPSIGMLTAAEKTTLNDWLTAGAPGSAQTCNTTPAGMGGGNGEDIDVTGLECVKFLAHARGSKTGKYPVGTAVDLYLNFGFQAPWSGTVYGQVVRPVIDNASALHHWLLYREPVADGSIQETIGQHGGGELIHGWAPGGSSLDFRKFGDVSFEMPGTTYAVEFHYNSSKPDAQDASGVEVCYKKQKTANLASLSWLGYDQGGTISYASGLCFEPSTSWTGTCKPTAREPIHLMFMVPHLHQSGRHLKAVINGPNGSRVLHDKPFDFAYQMAYETKEVLMPGESITTTCTFSAPNCAGQSTSQEMCYLFTYAYPKLALADQGPEGTFMHGEGVCLGQ
jgi:Copper type II ascorbate-dependent monooxygenase, C-terminal domain